MTASVIPSADTSRPAEHALDVRGLSIQFSTPAGLVTVVDNVDIQVDRGQVLGIAGESGSGKTVSVLALLGLLEEGAVVRGTALLDGVDLLGLSPKSLRKTSGRDIAMVFQDPNTSLHPMLSVGRQLTEHVRHHLGLDHREARLRAIEVLNDVRLPDPEGALRAYPHQFSGGQRQRIAIAIALACRPKLLIADEPTTALDVTVQAGIIRLIDRLRREAGLSVIFVSHDLGVLSSIADTLSIFYAGRVVESGTRLQLLQHPRHPYTRGLLDALPRPTIARYGPLVPIVGAPPSPRDRPSGCAFHPRCRYAVGTCTTDIPPLIDLGTQRSACPIDPLRLRVT